MKKSLLLAITLIVSVIPLFIYSQALSSGWLLGSWNGEGTGAPGNGGGRFSFTKELNGKVIVRKAHSEYNAPGGGDKIVHEDLMVIYTGDDNTASKAIYWDNEGHTIHYNITNSDSAIIFLTDKTPGVPIFRLSYLMLNTNTMNVKFEISGDGEHFKTYIEGRCHRVDELKH